jgi:hypothetical protein
VLAPESLTEVATTVPPEFFRPWITTVAQHDRDHIDDAGLVVDDHDTDLLLLRFHAFDARPPG